MFSLEQSLKQDVIRRAAHTRIDRGDKRIERGDVPQQRDHPLDVVPTFCATKSDTAAGDHIVAVQFVGQPTRLRRLRPWFAWAESGAMTAALKG